MKKRDRKSTPFWDKIKVTSNGLCWEWKHFVNPKTGYGQLNWFGSTRRAHRIAYESFYGPVPQGDVIRHLCNNKLCCNPRHLARGSQKDNCEDAKKLKRHSHGVLHGMAKLNESQVVEIFKSTMTQRALAFAHGISQKVVHLIKSRQTWKHVTCNL